MTGDFPESNEFLSSYDPSNPDQPHTPDGHDLETSSPTGEPEMGSESVTELDADLDPEPNLNPDPDPDLDLNPDLASELDPEPEPDIELEPELDLGYLTPRAQVYLKAIGDRVLVILPPPMDRLDSVAELTWQEVQQQLSQRLNAGERFWSPDARVTLVVGDRLLDNTQLQDLEETLAGHDLALSRVQTGRRETAIAAVTAGYSVDQQALQPRATAETPNPGTIDPPAAPLALAEPLYMRTTVRSGIEVRHPGSVIVFGDVNPGGSIIADGDIIVWGKLRGLVHAGANGNARSIVAALQMEPTQIRITDTVARAPSQNPDRFYPEVAYVTRQGIRISRAEDFPRQAARIGLGS
jgi:septum site-determining protein MinC